MQAAAACEVNWRRAVLEGRAKIEVELDAAALQRAGTETGQLSYVHSEADRLLDAVAQQVRSTALLQVARPLDFPQSC